MACTDADVDQYSAVLVGMISLGCPKNLVDGESMLGILASRGFAITPDADRADVIIVNTCGFIDAAKKESIGAILDMAEKKVTSRCSILIVTGCLSERYRDSFYTEFPEVDAVLGTGEYGRIGAVIENLLASKGFYIDSSDNYHDIITQQECAIPCLGTARTIHESTALQRLEHLNADRVLTSGTGSVYIKIAEGCENNCAYCIIPLIRGQYISRNRSDIIAEAERLSMRNDIEAVLVAQDTTLYGAEIAGVTANDNFGTDRLCNLLEDLSKLDRVRWIRLMYAYPSRIDEMLIEQFINNRKLLRYLDVPIQHASDGVLRGMGRRYGRADLLNLIDNLRRLVPGIVLRTTVMTGFPGERDEDFYELLDFIKIAKFERLGVFTYSREEGTRAAAMPEQVPKTVARKRRSELLRAQAAIMSKTESERVGHQYEAIIVNKEQLAGNGALYTVRTYAEAPDIDGVVRIRVKAKASVDDISANMEPGGFINVRITGMNSNGLYGEVVR